MNKATSLYLDAARFIAALAVLESHLASNRRWMLGGLPWQLTTIGVPAVAVFFVLSGYVIAHVLATRERDLVSYTASRFGRLYSVVLPALLLTFVCDHLDALRMPIGSLPQDYSHADQGLRYLATGLFVNRYWVIAGYGGLEPGTNIPFWSLSFEVAYYIAIAAIVFGRGLPRALLLAALCLLAGPMILLWSPLWFLGYALYRRHERLRLKRATALGLWLAGAALCMLSVSIGAWLLPFSHAFLAPDFVHARPIHHVADWQSAEFLAAYASGIGFALSLIAVLNLSKLLEPVLSPAAGAIRWLGSLTFALYLFQRPLLMFFESHPVAAPHSALEWIWVHGGIFFVVATLGHFCEASKGAYKRFFLWAHGRFRLAFAGVP